jgi:DNA repair protein RadC
VANNMLPFTVLNAQSITANAHRKRPGTQGKGLLPLPVEDRPRERLACSGPTALSSPELLAVVLGTGTQALPVLDLAAGLLEGGLRGLAGRSLAELEAIHGLGRAKAARILAALEMGARLASETRPGAPEFATAASVAQYLLPRYGARPVETFGLLALDVRHRLKREAVISVGCLTSSLVHPREVFQEAVVNRAAGLILFHNHPSGDPEPSPEDLSLTRRLVAAGALLGIAVLDHLVLGAGRFVSLRDRGAL